VSDSDADGSIRGALRATIAEGATVTESSRGTYRVAGSKIVWMLSEDGRVLIACGLAKTHPVVPEAEDRTASAEADVLRVEETPEPFNGVLGHLLRLVELREAGHLTEAEFSAAKAKFLA
jgi:hypothetical protein